MSWGVELWDQYNTISDHTHKGIEFLDRYGAFVKERCTLELEYASKLKRLVKNYQLKKKDTDCEDGTYSYCRAFVSQLQEVADLAGQHEVIAENMMTNISREITLQLKELKDERKRYLAEGSRFQATYAAALTQLDKAKKSYDKAFRESEKALDLYHKADADLNLSRAEVEKSRMISLAKGNMCEEAKSEYANQLQKTNKLQQDHFHQLMPQVFNHLQDMEERRIACIQNYIKQSALIHRDVFPIINKCLEGIVAAADSIAPRDDTLLTIEKFKTGLLMPEDFPFEDLSDPSTLHPDRTSGSTLNYSNSIKNETLRGTISVSKLKKRGGIFNIFGGSNKNATLDSKDDYAELPPNQRRKRLLAKIDNIHAQISQETAVRDGLMKMRDAYQANPAMGDPNSCEGQLTDSSHRIEKLQAELRKFNGYLDEVETGKPATPRAQKKKPSNRSSISEDSLSRSASDSSVRDSNGSHHYASISNRDSNSNHNDSSTPKSQPIFAKVGNGTLKASPQSNPIPQIDIQPPPGGHPTNKENESPESGISTSHLSLQDPDAEFVDAEESHSPDGAQSDPGPGRSASAQGDFDTDCEPLPTLAKAKALYPFEAQSEGSMAMEENEELEVVELDQGDGWTRVRRLNGEEEGFVPTSYITVEEVQISC